MIVGAGKKLEKIRTVLSNDVNDIYICKNILDKNDTGFYTLVRIHNTNVIKEVLEAIYKNNKDYESNNLPKSLFCDIFVEVDTLNILIKYFEPRKLFLYLKSYMTTDYDQHVIIKNFLYQCLALDVDYRILNLILDKNNINLNEDLSVFFNGFLDFSKFDKSADEKLCVQKCCDLINDILVSNEELTEKSQVKSINLFIKKKRNNAYKKMIDLYNDFKIKETKYKKNKESIFENIKSYFLEISQDKLKKIIFSIGLVLIILALIILVCDLFRLDLPFKKYQGMNTIGTVNMGER
ncbi:MAG: hypothetical protein J6C55_01700 [Oscillospiraceae bacterium]|nr:hypothetical protein [Oscillospiraceae bacterium]